MKKAQSLAEILHKEECKTVESTQRKFQEEILFLKITEKIFQISHIFSYFSIKGITEVKMKSYHIDTK